MNEQRPYGDLTAINRTRELLDTIGKATLERIARSSLDLLDTSSAIYEADGSYATAFFTSSYCKLLDEASWRLCSTENPEEALNSGKWLCHESCWTEASRRSIETGKPYDLHPCAGGINIYAVPIKAGDRIIGSINFGYGTPPTNEKSLDALAAGFNIDRDKLFKAASEYTPRPDYVIDAEKRHIELAAELIGELYMRKKTEAELREHLDFTKRMNAHMIDREMRMEELRKECATLRARVKGL